MARLPFLRRSGDRSVEVVPLLKPSASVDGWTLAGTPLAKRLSRAESRELATLLHGVHIRADTPWTYERAAAMLEQHGEPAQALAVCEAWFALPAATAPANSQRTRAIGRRRARLRSRLSTAS